MLRYEPARLIFYQDIERCPYTMFTWEAAEWSKKDEKRLELIALERYVMIYDYLKKTNQYLKD